MMRQLTNVAGCVLRLVAVLVVVSLVGEESIGQQPATAQKPGGSVIENTGSSRSNSLEVPRNLGQPLVAAPNDLKRLDPSSPAWIDKKNKQVVLIGTACRANYPLEFFATYPDRGYESVVVVYTKPSVVHAALWH